MEDFIKPILVEISSMVYVYLIEPSYAVRAR